METNKPPTENYNLQEFFQEVDRIANLHRKLRDERKEIVLLIKSNEADIEICTYRLDAHPERREYYEERLDEDRRNLAILQKHLIAVDSNIQEVESMLIAHDTRV